MEQNEQLNGATVSVGDLFKALFSKIKLIVCITILGAILGAAMSMFNVSYAASLSFYVTPADDSDALLHELNSSRFAESLLLDKNGLPEKSLCDPEDYQAAIDAIKIADKLKAERIEHAEEMELFNTANNNALNEAKHARLIAKRDELLNLVQSYLSDYPAEIAQDPDRMAQLAEYERMYAEAVTELETFENDVWFVILDAWKEMQNESSRLTIEMHRALDDVREAKEALLVEWRQLPEVALNISAITNSVAFEYSAVDWVSKDADNNIGEDEKTASLSKSFINAFVDVEKDEELANDILNGLMEKFPVYVENFIFENTNSVDPDCKLMSTAGRAVETSGFLRAGTVKSAILYAVVAFALSVVAVIAVYLAVQSGVISLKPKRKSKKAESCDKPESKS